MFCRLLGILTFATVLAGLLAPAAAQSSDIRPRPPLTFDVARASDRIALTWTSQPGEPDPVSWEIYRTSDYIDRIPYQRLATLPGSARRYDDTDYVVNTGYFYYIVAVGPPAPVDPLGLAGTPDGGPFRSARYLAQTNTLTAVGFRPGIDGDSLSRNAPNPFSEQTTLRFIANGPAFVRIAVYNAIGQEVAVLFDDLVDTFESLDLHWNGRDHAGRRVASGIYYCQMTTSTGYRQAIPMAYLRR